MRDAPKVVVDPKGQLSVASYRDVYGNDGGKNRKVFGRLPSLHKSRT